MIRWLKREKKQGTSNNRGLSPEAALLTAIQARQEQVRKMLDLELEASTKPKKEKQ